MRSRLFRPILIAIHGTGGPPVRTTKPQRAR